MKKIIWDDEVANYIMLRSHKTVLSRMWIFLFIRRHALKPNSISLIVFSIN